MDFFRDSIEDTFLTLFEGVSEGVIVVNTKQMIVASNTAARTIFGYQKEEMEGALLTTIIPTEYHKKHTGYVKEFMAHQDKRQMGIGRDLFGLHKDGSKMPVEVGLNPFVLHGHPYIMALITDITVRKQQEDEIRDINASLESKVKERTLQLTKALAAEKELNELKTKFLSLVSHEFKTPLSGILTSATLAGKYTKDEQQEKREKHLKTIRSKVKHLNTIIDDFLSIERLQSGKVTYKFTSFPISKIFDEVIYDANMHLKDGQIIKYPKSASDLIIEFDEKILELVLTNLIHNAIKYSGEDSIVAIDIEKSDTQLQIAIKDEGIGIPEKEQKFIFDRYFRAENALTCQGTGIGLNIVKNHLENLKSTISFQSEQDVGSTFTITIPLSQD
ncbi:PAS domain-containing sensor histidine kinase [uncultured Dokdonia sp.]|uniref:PAS domain-containing sensor histidine kinase n=1 Tax=uncultured Dokdonia sp. TaxID=575653 RepID=UPI002634C45A|nr:PAS domain-containing sensor histidine kinase [uncultured Dokdonia sp.]